jgi:2-C-methyl-D-erythritol 2,4-cyclodiphosphate synthase
MTNIRVGMGYDVHQLDENLPFCLGGVNVEYTKGIVAHSDGDIVFHALSDALLGAAGLGDIGHFFPDTDMKYKNIDSSVILLDVVAKLKQRSYRIINTDITIVLEKPKLQLYLPNIKDSISNYLQISISHINIKATTSEGMGFVGKGQGLACYAVVLIEKL